MFHVKLKFNDMKKIRRNVLEHSGKCSSCVSFPPNQTSQFEPSLHDILVRYYQNGQDVSQYVTTQASKATADMQFANRVGKVDFLTEIPQYIKKLKNYENNQLRENDVNDNKKENEVVKQNVENQNQENVKQS